MLNMKKILLLAGLVLFGSPALRSADPVPPEEEIDRKIAPGDTIIIEVFGEKDLTVERRVQKSGTILFPLLQMISVSNKTPGEVALELQEALNRDYLVNPQVSVTVREYAARMVTISGGVLRAGAFVLPGEIKWRILDVIGQAGGISPRGNEDKIEFTRGGKTQIFKLKDLKKEDPEKAIVIEAGDGINVVERFF